MKISDHKCERPSRSWLNHSATVVLEDGEEMNHKLICEVSAKCGYHPAGYGLYREKAEEIDGNKYLVTWQTSYSCD